MIIVRSGALPFCHDCAQIPAKILRQSISGLYTYAARPQSKMRAETFTKKKALPDRRAFGKTTLEIGCGTTFRANSAGNPSRCRSPSPR